MGRAFRFGVGDVLVGLLLIGLVGTAGTVAAQRSREIANRAKCASNLHQIGLAILLYQQDNNQLYPRTIMEKMENGTDPKPTWGTPYADHKDMAAADNADPFDGKETTPAVNDVSAAFFLLMRNEQISSQVFICPATKLQPWQFGGGKNTAQNWTNWPGTAGLGEHLSYSYQDPYPSAAAMDAGYSVKNPDPTFAVASDMNPGGDAVTKVSMQSKPDDLQAANSFNHAQAGQNVLYGDGHAEWQTNPFCGTQHDNIFTAGGPEVAGEPTRGTAAVARAAVSATDSILLPAAKEIGYVAPPPAKPMTPAERQTAAVALRGHYGARFGFDGNPATLVIDEKTIRCETGPVTLNFNYTVVGDDAGSLKLKLTAPNTAEDATATLQNDVLTMECTGRYTLSAPWRKAAAPATKPAAK